MEGQQAYHLNSPRKKGGAGMGRKRNKWNDFAKILTVEARLIGTWEFHFCKCLKTLENKKINTYQLWSKFCISIPTLNISKLGFPFKKSYFNHLFGQNINSTENKNIAKILNCPQTRHEVTRKGTEINFQNCTAIWTTGSVWKHYLACAASW